MWRKEDGNPQTPEVSPASATTNTPGKTASPGTPAPAVSGKAPACVSQGIKIKGELTGSEDLFIDGIVDGKVNLSSSTLTVGPNATLKAEIIARELVIRGRAEGKFTATERVQIWSTARVEGDIKSERISIEEGAQLQGRVEVGKPADALAQSGKKSESSKVKETQLNDAKAASGATAGAD